MIDLILPSAEFQFSKAGLERKKIVLGRLSSWWFFIVTSFDVFFQSYRQCHGGHFGLEMFSVGVEIPRSEDE